MRGRGSIAKCNLSAGKLQGVQQRACPGSVEVVDQLGRTDQSGRQRVERIASALCIANSLVIALGAGDKIVGVETYAKDSKLYSLRQLRIC